MRREEEIFFAILRSVLLGDKVESQIEKGIDISHVLRDCRSIDWRCVLNIAARHRCLHAFGVWIKSHRISTPFDKQLQANMFMVLQRQARLNHLAADVIALLENNAIPAVLIKGYSLSSYYPDPDTRDFGDVDIYVGEKNYERATEIVTAAYPDAHWRSDIRGGIHYILVLDESLDRVIELHRVTMEFHDAKSNALFQTFTRKHLQEHTDTLDLFGKMVPIPSAGYNALYVFMHAWHHFESTGVGFRQLGDWALCLHRAHQQLSQEEWQLLTEEFSRILTALRMKTAWQTFGYILVHHLHLPIEAMPLYTARFQCRADRLLRQLLRDGHGARPTQFCIKEIALMRRFPWERPSKNRLLQVGYTFCRLLFEAWQMGKFFPVLALHELISTFYRSFTKRTDIS